MSLTTILNPENSEYIKNREQKDPIFKKRNSMIRKAVFDITPDHTDFTHDKIIKTKDNTYDISSIIVNHNLDDRKFKDISAVCGTAFDYLARIIFAKKTMFNIDECFNNFSGLNTTGIYASEYAINYRKLYENKIFTYVSDDNKNFNKYHNCIIGLTNMVDIIEKVYYDYIFNSDIDDCENIIDIAIVLSQLDTFNRGKQLTYMKQWVNINHCLYPQMLMNELKELIKCYLNNFFSYYKKIDYVEYNPHFNSKATIAICGADGDIVINTDLIDYKTSKKGMKYADMTQVIGYYLLSLYDNRYDIENLCIYEARYGLLKKFNVNKINKGKLNDSLNLFKEAIDIYVPPDKEVNLSSDERAYLCGHFKENWVNLY